MKVTPNKPHDLHVRLTKNEFTFVTAVADQLDRKPADIIRMLIDTAISQQLNTIEND